MSGGECYAYGLDRFSPGFWVVFHKKKNLIRQAAFQQLIMIFAFRDTFVVSDTRVETIKALNYCQLLAFISVIGFLRVKNRSHCQYNHDAGVKYFLAEKAGTDTLCVGCV